MRAPEGAGEERSIEGLIYAHREYPAFLPKTSEKRRPVPFSFAQGRWHASYSRAVLGEQASRPANTLCFRLVGKGRFVENQVTLRWPIEQRLIITSVRKLIRLSSGAECEAFFQ